MRKLYVDFTHVGRRATGIERLSEQLFSREALEGFEVEHLRSGPGKLSMIAAQQFGLPVRALRDPGGVFVFPGLPPSPVFPLLAAGRTVFYVHDLFFITHRVHANRAGKYYFGPEFGLAVRRLRNFFVNSDATWQALSAYCAPDARIVRYRPPVPNVFGLDPVPRSAVPPGDPLRFVALGTIEPRKNLMAAAAIVEAVAARGGRPAEFHVVGRRGWGDDHIALDGRPGVTLHGALPDAEVRRILGTADFLINTSHDEGLGLPLLEAQHGGLAVIAPRQPIFAEVLGDSGLLIDPADPAGSADRIIAETKGAGWRERHAGLARENLARWAASAASDQVNAKTLLRALAAPR